MDKGAIHWQPPRKGNVSTKKMSRRSSQSRGRIWRFFLLAPSNICPEALRRLPNTTKSHSTFTYAKMVTKSKLKMALAAEKGTDFKKLKLLKKQKEAEKRNAAARGADKDDEKKKTIEIEAEFEDDDEEDEEDDEEEDEEEEDEEPQVCYVPSRAREFD